MNRISFGILIFVLAFASCKQKHAPQAGNKTQFNLYYTCSMHPQVHEEHPGSCPICGMKLIKVEITGPSNTASDRITLTATQLQLGAIATDTMREENTGAEKTLTGTVSANENNTDELSARIGGRIQRLFIRTVGEKISTGSPVYTIYSEDLQETQKEYLLALQQQKQLHNPDVDYLQLINAAENKLRLWGLTPSQIIHLANTGKVSATTTIYSKVNGTVSDILIHEGDYVTEGMPILKTQALNSLWVEAQIYGGETENYKENDRVTVSLPDLNGLLITGKVAFVNPDLSPGSNVDLLRISITNINGSIRPGMLAYINIAQTGKLSLAVPATAVLTDGMGSKVWVKNTDGSFSPKMVKVNPGNRSYVPVISGLSRGDVVVTRGAYLLNSEAIFKNGGDMINMKGMKM